MSDEKSTDQVTVSTYVPEYQKEEWVEDAEKMGMSMSEFVRCMVQAGRRDFDLSDPTVPRGELRDRVVAALRAVPDLTWDELTEVLSDEVSETDLERVLEDLQQSGEVVVRRGGRYVLTEE